MVKPRPAKQKAVQLTGQNQLVFNPQKEMYSPNDYQILAKVEAVGLCFSDLKLLKQFSEHVRKSEIVSGISQDVLAEIPSYVPGQKPAVPGHEVVVKVESVGSKVKDIRPGERYLVQADYRWVKTKNSNGAFGYNFEGGLQEYILVDQRVIISPEGQSTFIRASEDLSASAIALVEPWACVEQAYAVNERTMLKKDGRMLVVQDVPCQKKMFDSFVFKFGGSHDITFVSKDQPLPEGEACFDDVIYFGSNPDRIEKIFPKIASNGLINIVLCGGKLPQDVVVQIGRVHYGNIRIIGTTGSDPAQSMKYIPATGEIRKNNKINIVGAAGPMGVMHVVRNICQAIEGTAIFAADLDDTRLAALEKIAEPIAAKNKVTLKCFNPKKNPQNIEFDYSVLMAPVPALVCAAVANSADKAIINIFAGIPASVNAKIDLNRYIEKHLYFIGTSGSTINDMITVLKKVESRQLDTNISLGAVCGIESAIEGIKAVENQSISGKIIVYPSVENLPLTKLENLNEKFPKVAKALCNGLWCKESENILLKGEKNG
ncbi:MAG: alcohol dehydrogenase catalytic domain-containing protein [Phycisphaerales bacterium]